MIPGIGTIILAFLLVLLSAFPVTAQDRRPELGPGTPVAFSLFPDEIKAFRLQMKQDGFAEITWLANDSLVLFIGIFDSAGKVLESGNSSEIDSLIFVAPTDGEFTLAVKYEKSSGITGPQRISLEYLNKFVLPPRTRQKDIRTINGYNVKIMTTPESGDESIDSVIVIEKGGKVKEVIKAGGGADYIGFSFQDDLKGAKTANEKRIAALVKNTPDKTGDGIPDIMIDYFSGGAHCCSSTYFINLGEQVELVEVINTEHAGMSVMGKNPKGGLRFATNENAFAYWNIHFAGSPLPPVTLEFTDGRLRPNFDLMKKPPPRLAALKSKARAARGKISLDAYTEDEGNFAEAFWDEMLDLIYTGNEPLAWQYFDLVWPAQKPGKEIFLADFKKQLAESYYGTKEINTSNSLKTFMRGFQKILPEIKETN